MEGGGVEGGSVESKVWRVEVWRVNCGGWKCRCASDIIGRQFLYIFTSFHMLYMYVLPS